MTDKTRSTVAIIRCPEYDAEMIHSAVARGFELLGGYEKFFSTSDRILLKPNMLAAKKPEVAVTTHPEFIRGVIKFFKSKNPPAIMAGDSPGGAVSGTQRVWNETGIGKVCDEEQVLKLNFEKSGLAHLKTADPRHNKRVPVLEISRACLPTTDDNPVGKTALISLPKMKTHTLMLFTGAIKNLYGCIPGLRKAHYHFHAVHPDDFARILADIMYYTQPRFAITDAIVSMEGEGPSAGKQRHTGLIVMGGDLVAVDTVLGTIMGFDTTRDPTIRACARMGLGIAEIEKIDIVSDDKPALPAQEILKDFVIKDFQKPSNLKVRLVPRFLGPMVKKIFWAKPRINPDICSRCRLCMNSCPAKAIFRKDDSGTLVVDKTLCIECMCCHELCPDKAIEIEYSFLADILTRRSSARRKSQ